MSFGKFATATELRDAIKDIAEGVVNKERPPYKYATVTEIHREQFKARVLFPDAPAPVTVNMGAIQPSEVGQTVRIEGKGVDKYIADILGEGAPIPDPELEGKVEDMEEVVDGYNQIIDQLEQDMAAAQQELADAKQQLNSKLDGLESDLGETAAELQGIKDNVLPDLDDKLSELYDETIPTLRSALDSLNDIAIPALEGRLESAEQALEDVEEGLDDLSGVLGRLSQAEQDISAAEGKLDTLENTTLPAVEQAIQGAQDWIDEDGANLASRLSTAEGKVSAAEGRLDAAEQDISDVFGEVGEAKQDASAAASAAQDAQTTADTARSEATSKAEAAEQAAKAHAEAKSEAARLAAIAEASGDATDKANAAQAAAELAAAADATAKANAAQAAAEAKAQTAQEAADTAHSAAGSAQETADLAMAAAGTKTTTTYSTGSPAGNGKTEGDTHRQRNSSNDIVAEWRWSGSSWVKQEISSQAIANLDVGKLTAGAADIASVVAQKIAAASGQFIELDVKQLTASTANMNSAVIDKLWADVVRSRRVTTDMLVVSGQQNRVPNGDGTALEAGAGWDIDSTTVAWTSGDAPDGLPGYFSLGSRYSHGTATKYVDGASFDLSPGTVQLGAWIRRTTSASSTLTMRLVTSERSTGLPFTFISRDEGFTSSSSGNGTFGAASPTLDEWVYCQATIKVTEPVRAAVIFYSNASAARYDLAGIFVKSLVGADLIVDGAIAARHITASESLSSKVGQFLELRVDQLTVTGSGNLKQAVINKLWTDVVRSREITADMIGANQIIADHITASSAMWTKVLGAHKINANDINAESIAGGVGSFLALNANQITSGTINTARLNAQQVAGAVATFLQIRTDQLTVTGSAGLAQAVVDELWAKKIAAGKILANEVLIGSGENLFPDPNFLSDETWASGSLTVTNDGPNGTRALRIPATTSQTGRYTFGGSAGNLDTSIPITPGRRYSLSVRCKSASAIASGDARLYIRWSNGTEDFTSSAMLASASATPANTWTDISGETVAPAGAALMAVGFYTQPAHNAITFFAAPKVVAMIDSSLIVDGGVLARHLNVVDVDTVKDKALTIQPDGLRLYSTADIEGEPAVSLTSTGADYLSITSGGETVAGMNDEGIVTGNILSAAEDVLLQGDSLQEILDDAPQGVIARYERNVSGRTLNANRNTDGWQELLEVEVDLYQGRVYRWDLDPIGIQTPPLSRVYMYAFFTTDGTTPTTDSASRVLSIFYNRSAAATTSNDTMVMMDGFRYFIPTGNYPGTRILIAWRHFWGGASSTLATASVSTLGGMNTARFTVTDLGARTYEDVGVDRTKRTHPTSASSGGSSSGGDDPNPPKSYKNTWTANNSASYTGSGAVYSYAGRSVYQGYWLAANGNLRGLWTFPSSVWGATSGSTVTKVRLYVKNSHSNLNAGLTAYFGTHARSTLANPGTSRSNGWSTKFAKGEGKWIDLTGSAFNYFKSRLEAGNPVGMMIYTTGSGNYGYFAGAAKIEVTYKK